ncbi:3-phosphoserine/phosphohydroxythreonine transaminase [Sphingobacteriales bacterium UPWRP_1]|nr:phosphoserine transaminase [Sphingobacteriales bacterium TSM_CSS]PSJ77634.1 3-phosphoserine/phosphohydroxythreonine transaminase [Sphingobacteriales bacterium UPWRP_1]
MKKINFYAGPSILPREVIEQLAQGVLNFNESGLSVLEISHRSADFEAVIANACELVKELLHLPAHYEVLFLGGGASMQFCQVPYNLLPPNGTAAYVNTGVWATGAIHEARFFGNTEVVASSEEGNFSYIPQIPMIGKEYAYLHITTNNTIFGTQYHQLPTCECPLVADMSSDIFSKKTDASKFDLFYAGAQKNLGPAGTTLVVVNPEILGKTNRAIPTMLNYQTHIKKGSMFNTPPVFAVYGCYLTLQWIKKRGIEQIEADNNAKAALLYAEIDRNSLFTGTAKPEHRSVMNATFTINRPELEKTFLQFATEAGCVGIKGHRLVGGFRASMYNAMNIEGVKTLAEVMKTFENKYA